MKTLAYKLSRWWWSLRFEWDRGRRDGYQNRLASRTPPLRPIQRGETRVL